jgi:cytochrome d ubiquinol oxidase subunit I
VHGILRTADATSPVPAATIATTLALFVLVYGFVFATGIYYINRLINRGPQVDTHMPDAKLGTAMAAPQEGL